MLASSPCVPILVGFENSDQYLPLRRGKKDFFFSHWNHVWNDSRIATPRCLLRFAREARLGRTQIVSPPSVGGEARLANLRFHNSTRRASRLTHPPCCCVQRVLSLPRRRPGQTAACLRIHVNVHIHSAPSVHTSAMQGVRLRRDDGVT